jgi:hypothetical protein
MLRCPKCGADVNKVFASAGGKAGTGAGWVGWLGWRSQAHCSQSVAPASQPTVMKNVMKTCWRVTTSRHVYPFGVGR